MKSTKKSLVVLGICTTMAIGALVGFSGKLFPVTQAFAEGAADPQVVQVTDLVIKFLGVPEYEPNRYTKSNGGKWAPEELEKGLLIKAEMKLGQDNPEGMMAPLKFSLADITAIETADPTTGIITIVYNGLTLTMEQGKNTATLNDGTTSKTLTMNDAVTPYFKLMDGETNEDGSPYYVCYLPVKFTGEALGGTVVWNAQVSRMEMAFAFYYSNAAISPVINTGSAYTTVGMEGGSYPYATLSTRLTVKSGQDATAVAKNTADLIKATLNVVNPAYQNDDGGWGKTNTAYDLLNDTFATLCNPAHSTFDNGSTHGHMKFLAAVLRLAKENPTAFVGYETQLKTIETGFWKSVKFITNAQNAVGGWPQYYPYGVGYFKNITFNDNAMPNVMAVVYALTNVTGLTDSTLCNDFAWARAEIAAQTNPDIISLGITNASIKSLWDDGLKFTLGAQNVVGGVITGWSQQYDPKTGKPTGGRAFELSSVSTSESNSVLKILTNINNPTTEVKAAINGYVSWVQTIGITGYSVYTIKDRTRELGSDKLLVADGSTSTLFGRFYGLDTTGAYYGLDISNKLSTSNFYEVFSGRDGIAKTTLNGSSSERRIGYSFLSGGFGTDPIATYKTWNTAMTKLGQ